MTTVLLALSGLILAQNRTRDEEAIDKQIDAMITSWNQHNYDDLKNYTTENTDWVNVVGMWWKGRKQSQYAHQVYHDTFLKPSMAKKKSATIRFVTKDVAIVHLVWHFQGDVTLPDGRKAGESDDLATLVYVNQNGKWLMEAGENVEILQEAQQFDPVRQMPKN